MKIRAARSLAVLAVLALAGCSDTDVPQRIGIDQDISATHDADGPTIFDLGQRSAPPWHALQVP